MNDAPGPLASDSQEPSAETRGPSNISTAGEAAGDCIDRYKLIEPLGEGGMGTVWLAQQSEPVRRLVALKIVKLGMDTREVILRFEAERQALALMDHPHVAKVLDGGATTSGRPYFVMERVEGSPITEFCNEHGLDLDKRLELFVKVCEAIQHAHLKGIIHRDIKPSNVLVAHQGGIVSPIVIDFGVAKATGGGLTQQTLMTGTAQILGTPEYMPPEQATLSGADIDTRADIYSLGVLLYELLTGTKPFELRDVIESGYSELLRTIREVVPARPSTRVSTLGAHATQIAIQRGASIATLRKRLHGDLDWIVMRALEKERARRYSTASEFAADVQRYRVHEPVVAAPPSARYRVAKFVQRRRKTVAVLTGFASILVAGSIGTGVGLVRTMDANTALDLALLQKGEALEEEKRQRGLAQHNETRARLAEQDAISKAERARQAEAESAERAKELLQVTDFQSNQLSSIDAALMGTRLRAALEAAAPKASSAELSPIFAEVNFTDIASHALEANLFAPAILEIDSQFKEQPIVRAKLLQSVAQALESLGRRESALGPRSRALRLQRSKLGDKDIQTLRSISSLAYLQEQLGEIPEARANYTEAMAGFRTLFGHESKDAMIVLHNQSLLAQGQSLFAEAEALEREAIAIAERVLTKDDTDFVNLYLGLGGLLQLQGKGAEAKPYLDRSIELCRRVLGDRAPQTLTAIHSMGALHFDLGQPQQAIEHFREALEGRRLILGADHVHSLASTSSLGLALRAEGKPEEAELYLREALEGTRRNLGVRHPHALSSLTNLGGVLESQGKTGEAEACYREALKGLLGVVGKDGRSTLTTTAALGALLVGQGHLVEGEALLWTAMEGYRRILGIEHIRCRRVIQRLEDLLKEELTAARNGGDDEATGLVLARLGKLFLERAKAQAAEPLLDEALELLEGSLPEDDPRTWMLMSDLGAAIAVQERFAEAATLLVQGAEELISQSTNAVDSVPGATDTATAIDRVTTLYASWHISEPTAGHAEQATEWHARQAAWLSSQAPPTEEE